MKTRIFVLVLLALLVLASPVAAIEVNATSSLRASTTLKVKASSTPSLRASTTVNASTSQERRIEFQQQIAKRQIENTARVIRATITRLRMIITRIESRVSKVESAGGNASSTKDFIAKAKVNLNDAEVKVNAFASIDLTSDKAQENFERIRIAAREAKAFIREAHTNLMLAVRNLKGVGVQATTTAEVEN